MKTCHTVELGLIGYAEACALQKRIVAACKAGLIGNVLLFCEHPHVITQGRNGKREHLLAGERLLRVKGVAFYETSRGGDITYHGPGQLVGYPILQLNEIRRDVVWYVRMLEEAMIRATAEFGVAAAREAGKTGVWVKSSRGPGEKDEKLAAIGVHLSRWVTSHGFAYNVSTDLRYFDLIVPCGIADRKPTSLEKILDRPVALAEVSPRIARHLGEVLGLEMREASRDTLSGWLREAESAATPLAETPLAAGAKP